MIKVNFIPEVDLSHSLPQDVGGNRLIDLFLSKNIETIKINWCDLFEDIFFVEDDIIYLTEAFNELPDFFSTGAQHVFLNDGGLEIKTLLE